jgi:cytochrome c-type biogenesis protein CcmF
VLTFTVLVGTIYPLLAEAVTGDQVSVGGPYFNRNTAPVVALLLFLMGIGPLLPWRAASASSLVRRLQWPAWIAAAAAVALALAGAGAVGTLIAALVAFVGVATLSEMTRGVRSQRRARGGSWPGAVAAAVRRNRRLYGGLVAHLGVLVAVVGISWSALADRSSEVAVSSGEFVRAGAYELRLDGVQTREESHRRVIVARVTVIDAGTGGEVVGLQPSLNLYPASSEPIGTPSIRVGTPWNGMRDLYVSLVSVEGDGDGSVVLRFFVNPGIGLLWLGGLVIALGGVVAAWPARSRTGPPWVVGSPAEPREEVRV